MELKLLLNLGTPDAKRLGLEKTKMAGDVVDVDQDVADELLRRGWAASVEDAEGGDGGPGRPDASATPQPSSSRPGPTPSASNPQSVQVAGGTPGVTPGPGGEKKNPGK